MFIVYHLWTKYYVAHNKKTCRICFFFELALYVVDNDNEGLYSFTVEKIGLTPFFWQALTLIPCENKN